jgi:hypothetical protein
MTTEAKPNPKVAIAAEKTKLESALKHSTILPADARAKAEPAQASQGSATNTSAIQKATQQCASLPQNRIVVKESVDKSSEEN